MPPQVAMLLCVTVIVCLWRSDMRWRRASSRALWVPGIWLAIISSRPLGYWFGMGGAAGATSAEGSPINLVVQGALMFTGLVILQRRSIDWGAVWGHNKTLIVFYLYLTLTAVWSYYPAASLKRITKDFGTMVMVLIVLTESQPWAAARLLFVRLAYILFPLSVVLIKYYPEYGRMYSKSWEPMYTGVTTHKNALGMLVMSYGVMLALDTMTLRHSYDPAAGKTILRSHYLMLLMGGWLLIMCNSMTALVCVVVGGAVLWGSRLLVRLHSPVRIGAACVVAVVAVAAVESALNLSGRAIHALGRREDLTGRTDIWAMVMKQPIDPLFGYGFMAFWDGPLGQAYNEEGGTSLRQAHNGYLEIYIDGGIVGILLLLLMLIVGGKRVLEDLGGGSHFARARLAFFTMALVHNYTEASFFRLNVLWFAFLLAIIGCVLRGLSISHRE